MIQLADLTSRSSITRSIRFNAIIDTALCVGAGGSSGSLADKPILRNAEGRLVIPGSQLKGRLRHECEKLARALHWNICESPRAERMCPQRAGLTQTFAHPQYDIGDRNPDQSPRHHCLICQLFGNPSLPSRVICDDFICSEAPETLPEVLRPGVTINRRRRTAEEGKLYFLETSPANVQLKFAGAIHLQSPWRSQPDSSEIQAESAIALILAALHHIHALGGSKSTGLGWLTWEFLNLDDLNLTEDGWNALIGDTL